MKAIEGRFKGFWFLVGVFAAAMSAMLVWTFLCEVSAMIVWQFRNDPPPFAYGFVSAFLAFLSLVGIKAKDFPIADAMAMVVQATIVSAVLGAFFVRKGSLGKGLSVAVKILLGSMVVLMLSQYCLYVGASPAVGGFGDCTSRDGTPAVAFGLFAFGGLFAIAFWSWRLLRTSLPSLPATLRSKTWS